MSERTVFQSMTLRHLVRAGPEASVHEAACLMTRANCGSVLVMEPPDRLLGIVTERDLMTRVLAKGLDADATPVGRLGFRSLAGVVSRRDASVA